MKSLVRRRIQIPVLLGLIVVFFLFASWIRPRQVLDGQEGDRHLKTKPQQFSVQPLGISNASIIHVSRFHDNRGYFQEILNEERYPAFANDPKQISVSHSKKNVVRGLHRSPYFKLVTVLSGKIIDILVDLDPISPTFKTWRAVELSAEAASQVFIPPKFGHGFIALADNTIVCYAQGGAFVAANEMDVNIFDPEIGISLPELQDRKSLTMSEKDLLSPSLQEALVSWKSRHG